MSLAVEITKTLISGIVSFSSIFNPAINQTIEKKPITQIQPKTLEVLTNTKGTKQTKESTKKSEKLQETNKNRKNNFSSISKTDSIQIELPLLDLKDIMASDVRKDKPQRLPTLKTPEKSVFDIINTIPTLPYDQSPKSSSHLNKIQNSLANVFCKTQSGNAVSVVTGSAVIINPLGVAITNAHVAQYLLIEKNFKGTQGKRMDCYGRTNSPASGTYKIDVLYISPVWIKTNSKNIIDPNFKETGVDDLAIIRFISPNSKPFNHTTISTSNIHVNKEIIIASYPASELRTKGLSASLYSQYENNSIKQLDFYNQSKPILETQSSNLGQAGSSGGGIFDQNGDLLGSVALILQGSDASRPYIRGLTVSHIQKTLSEDGHALSNYINDNPDIIRSNFAKTANELESILVETLSSSR